jgi:membrane-bound serine protease (ClpP class)
MARRAVLGAQVRGPDVDASALPANGATGTARTALRPVGRVTIAEQPFEAIAEDGFVEAGEPVQVVGREGGALRVRRIASA